MIASLFVLVCTCVCNAERFGARVGQVGINKSSQTYLAEMFWPSRSKFISEFSTMYVL